MSPLPVRPSKSPIHCSTQFSRLCLRHTLLNSQAPPSSTCYRARLSSPPGPTASVTFHVSMHTLVSHSDTSFRDPRSLIFLPLPFATVLSLLTFCPRHLHPLSRPAQSPRPAAPPSSSSPLLAVTSLARCSDLSHPLCPFHRVDVPSRALCANTLIGPSFQSPFPSPLALLRCLKLRDTMLAIHSQPTDSNHLPSPTPSPHRSRCLVGYIHLLAVCLVLGPFPPSLTVWTLMLPQTRGLICSPFSTATLPRAAHPVLASSHLSHFLTRLTCAVLFLLQGLAHALAHFGGQVLYTHSLLTPCRPSGHNGFPDPLNKPPLLPWLPGAVSCGSSVSGLSDRGGPLLHHPPSLVRGSSPDLPHPGPSF